MNQKTIDRIHLEKRAIAGKIYTGPNGILYYGHRNGHLVQEDIVSGELEGTTLRTKLKLGNFTIDDVVDLLEKEETNGEGGLSISGARNRKVTDSYVESNGVFMNESPVILPQDYILDSIAVSTKNNETWVAEIHNDKIPIEGATVSASGASSASATNLDILVTKGSKIMLYVSGTLIERPRITTIYKLPKN